MESVSVNRHAAPIFFVMSTKSFLHNLIQVLDDGREGFAHAAEGIENPELQPLLEAYSAERAEMVQELLAVSPPEVHDQRGTFAGALHRGFIDLKAAITARDEAAILAECEKGEDHAVAVFTKAAEHEDLTDDQKQVIDSLLVRIMAVHNAVKELRAEMKIE